MIRLRKKIVNSENTTVPVASPLAVLELMEWQAGTAFRDIASEAVGSVFMQNKGRKQIGEYLKKALELRSAEAEEQKKSGKRSGSSTGLETLMLETWLNGGYVKAHGLYGVLLVDIVNFHFSMGRTWGEPSIYAYLQLGGADILHILLAQHLGCQYFASFDEDFRRVRDVLKSESQLELLSSPEEVLAIF